MTTTASRASKSGRRKTAEPIKATDHRGRAALPTDEAAHYVGLAYGTLKKMRVTGDGPAYVRIGSRIVYLIEDLNAWLQEHRVA